jgi:hypothetical protein
MIYTVELAKKVCCKVAQGLPLRTICKLPDMPSKATICRWQAEKADFRLAYEVARDAGLRYYQSQYLCGMYKSLYENR